MTRASTPDISVIRFTNGPWKQNCYILHGIKNTAVIVDPGSDAGAISDLLEENGLRPLGIINTHGHFDHIGAVADLAERYDIPFYIHEGDEKLVRTANTYGFLFGSRKPMRIPTGAIILKNEDVVLALGGYVFDIIPTPGHTDGGVCFRIGELIFTGDTVLPSGPGRTDLPGGNKEKLLDSVAILRGLPAHLIAYAGHGSPRSLEEFWSRHDG